MDRNAGTDADARGDRDTMRGRVPGNRLKLWLLLEAKRWHVATVVLGLVFASLVVVGAVDPVSLGSVLGSADPVETVFQALVTAIITGVTLVVTINQLVLSQELGPLGDQYERMQGSLDTRRRIESELGLDVAPANPAAFLRAIVDVVHDRSDALAAADVSDPEVADRIESFTGSVTDNATLVSDQLADAEFGTFAVVSAALNFNYSGKIYEARRLWTTDADALSEDADDAFEELLDALELFGPAREHVKTLYFQWELIDLSRVLLYSALPALVVAVSMIVYFDEGMASWSVLGVGGPVWVTSAAVTVALVPFVFLIVYVLRIATVAKRTLAIGPFVLRGTEDEF
ncbi:hypothetical protein SAMN05216388_1001331 [Halorientalis persicus]|uniref:Uncharacterized protein n=1 Tax=Halorientalis persicus TaxID=1367881 RepID=A0A1H8DMS6_9EURY|nr:hypothetical protein [Halorientalis persicus]SEN08641.1 hypothetical protein SAMN05216388_1001331 [Halorientalis persicus]